jgi:hypothetical protein
MIYAVVGYGTDEFYTLFHSKKLYAATTGTAIMQGPDPGEP